MLASMANWTEKPTVYSQKTRKYDYEGTGKVHSAIEGNKGCYNEHTLWGPGPEAAESAKQWEECSKNPGHKTFIPVKEFDLHHMAEEWHREEFIKFIKVCSDLTVRLRVSYTSPARPDDGGCYSPAGGGHRVGTGLVLWVKPTTEHCPCICGQERPGQSERSWDICIGTAKHVVYDDDEVKATRVDFYHDSAESRADGTMKTLRGCNIVQTRDDHDWCEFTCICHDAELSEQMINQLAERDVLKVNLIGWLESLCPRPQIIVSHPHGRPKYVTVGHLTGSHFGMDTYSTDTCPGSSGALVVGKGWKTSRYTGPHHCQADCEGGFNKGFDGWW